MTANNYAYKKIWMKCAEMVIAVAHRLETLVIRRIIYGDIIY